MAAHPDYKRTKVVACATVIEEMLPFLPHGMSYEVLDFGLHLVPGNLKSTLQKSIDAAAPEFDTIVLGYGLCSMAVVGLRATRCTLVTPRLDDCIGIFLGSDEAYRQQNRKEPGTYYLTKGWVEVNDTPLKDYHDLVEKYGQARAERLMQVMLKNYTRVAYIDTGLANQERHREHARQVATHFNLKFEEIPGSNELVKKLIHGPWDTDEFVVTPPGEQIRYMDFKTATTTAANNLNLLRSTSAPAD